MRCGGSAMSFQHCNEITHHLDFLIRKIMQILQQTDNLFAQLIAFGGGLFLLCADKRTDIRSSEEIVYGYVEVISKPCSGFAGRFLFSIFPITNSGLRNV